MYNRISAATTCTAILCYYKGVSPSSTQLVPFLISHIRNSSSPQLHFLANYSCNVVRWQSEQIAECSILLLRDDGFEFT
jgi:hypothetical protein